jgi:hypothetical protein
VDMQRPTMPGRRIHQQPPEGSQLPIPADHRTSARASFCGIFDSRAPTRTPHTPTVGATEAGDEETAPTAIQPHPPAPLLSPLTSVTTERPGMAGRSTIGTADIELSM